MPDERAAAARAAQRKRLPYIVIKLRDDFPIAYVDEAHTQLDGRELDFWREIEAFFKERGAVPPALDRLFTALRAEAIVALVQRAQKLDPTYEPPNLLRYFKLHVPDADFAKEVFAQFFDADRVHQLGADHAYIAPGYRGAATCFTPNATALTASQAYLNGPPAVPVAGHSYGINAVAAWNDDGCGANVRFVDLEESYLAHAALPAITNLIAPAAGNAVADEHGTNSLGVVCAQGGAGQTAGIAPNCTPGFAALLLGSGISIGMDDSLLACLASAPFPLQFGDVILVEVEQTSHHPIEGQVQAGAAHAAFHLMRLASALGYVVVEAAGNGNLDVGIATDAASDSGAIMVGGSLSTHPFDRHTLSNWGARVNCFAWGVGVQTTSNAGTGFGLYGPGTSSATAIIAGAAVALQSAARVKLGHPISPGQIRKLLSDPATGATSSTNGTNNIGVMPNLGAVITAALSKSDAYLRDFVGDVGDPHMGAISASPDIILRNATSADPATEFGAATEGDNNLGQAALTGQDNFIYVRVKNRGAVAATNVTVDVYWSEPATLLSANLWLGQKVGTATIASVPAGNALTVITTPITWNSANIPAPGHYCFVAILGSDDDPAPNPADFLDWDKYTAFIRNNNNVTWRNFNVASPAMGMMHKAFLIAGAPDRVEHFDLEFLPQLPKGARLILDAPEDFEPLKKFENLRIASKGRIGIEIDTQQRRRFANLELPKGGAVRLGLRAIVPEEFWGEEHRVGARQIWRGQEMGRINFRYTLKEPGKPDGKHECPPSPFPPGTPPVTNCAACRKLCAWLCRLFNRPR